MPTARSSALRAAAQVIGGPASLASTLGVSELQLEQWMNGKESVPTEVFLQAVDLLERYDRRKTPRPDGNDTQPGHG
jgi:YdaS antitoxin of YdaST toxin-antitoxin system